MNKRGFTLVEVIVSFVLITAVSLALFKTTLSIQEKQKENLAINSFKAFNLAINNEIQYDFLTDKILSTTPCGDSCYDIVFENRGTVRTTLNKEDGIITYGSFKEKLPSDYKFYDNMLITSYSSDNEGLNSYVVMTIPVKSNYEPNLSNIKYMYQYDKNNPNALVDLNLPNASDIFASKVGECGLYRDDHDDLRYQGANPCNYVTFNDETWRIVGVFNIDGENRIKLVRKDSLGSYSWDTSDTSVNYGEGVTQWGPSDPYEGADLMRELNGDYLNSSLSANTNWYNGRNNQQTAEFNKEYVLKQDAKKLIADTTWHLGADTGGTINTLASVYLAERGVEHMLNPPDGITRTHTWKGKVGLIYPSDFGYASGNYSCRDNINSNGICDDNWMSDYGWTITTSSATERHGWYADTENNNGTKLSDAKNVHPSVYLKSIVKVAGEGTTDNPYIFS